MSDLDRATDAVDDGDLVVFPTETVYGLGADALDPAAVEAVYDAKRRDRDDPISLAVPDVDAATEFVRPTERTRRFMDAFLPGPVTVICERRDVVPDVLTGGRDRVGVRVPDHDLALSLLERVAPVTATSANVSGRSSARAVADLDDEIGSAAAVVLDDGETPGGGSTVVDVEAGEVVRRGHEADEVETWLADH
ncbi:threonylcarbamoyl-AMP synthase [Halobacteriales archaeon QS_1_68_20]|nr:MAG: threonylcarbamoyl-AMP synthase [Halobacteriales archaeon QS_1_68_20]